MSGGWAAGWMDGCTSLRLNIENLVLIVYIIESCGYSFLSLKVTHSFLNTSSKAFLANSDAFRHIPKYELQFDRQRFVRNIIIWIFSFKFLLDKLL